MFFSNRNSVGIPISADWEIIGRRGAPETTPTGWIREAAAIGAPNIDAAGNPTDVFKPGATMPPVKLQIQKQDLEDMPRKMLIG
jgi:hypothetical protein